MTTWAALLDDAERALDAAGLASPSIDARRIVEEVSDERAGRLALHADESAPAVAARRVRDMVIRRQAGEPLQYVLGSWSFLGLDLYLDPRVLIPRPETERTAQVALDEAARLGLRRGRHNVWRDARGTELVADLGTGSGAIALALATGLPDVEVWATDRSAEALAVARANLAGTGSPATRVRLTEGDWFDALPAAMRGQFRLIVSNPPYVATSELAALPDEVARHEPAGALVSGPTGLEAIEHLIAGAPEYFAPGAGTLVLEMAPHQAGVAVTRACDAGFNEVVVERDLSGRERILVARGG
jgi:release factor glutamine methyltransferase